MEHFIRHISLSIYPSTVEKLYFVRETSLITTMRSINIKIFKILEFSCRINFDLLTLSLNISWNDLNIPIILNTKYSDK